MHFQANPAAVQDGSHVRGDDGVHAHRLGRVQGVIGRLQIFLVQGNVQGHIGLDTALPANAHDLRQILARKIAGRMRTHVQVADPKVYGVGASLNGSLETVETACRGHDFQFFFLHNVQRYALNCYLCAG